MSRKEIFLANMDLNLVTNARTEFVRTIDVNFETKKGRLEGATFAVVVNVIGIDWASPNIHKRASHYNVRFSCGELRLNVGERCFPFAGRTKRELEALEEYSNLLTELLGLDKDYVTSRDEFPPTETDELRAQLKSVQDENWKLKIQADEATKKLNTLRESIGNLEKE